MIQQAALIINTVLLVTSIYAAYTCFKEKEQRALTITALGVLFHVALIVITLYAPALMLLVYGYYAFLGLGLAVLLIPRPPNLRALGGIRGYTVDDAPQPDARDTVSARNRLRQGTEEYNDYYSRHPERKEVDDRLRKMGRVGGAVDGGYRPNLAMSRASFRIPSHMGSIAYADPLEGQAPYPISPEKATMIVKNLARHLGAALVGVCKVDPLCIYTNPRTTRTGRWMIDGKEVDYPPYALVMATEMSHEHVNSAPHTPTAAETGNQYANGSYISTVLSQWFSQMGYTGIAEHTGHYDVVLPPMAFQAGLGEVGRNGYLITPTLGSRVRLCAVLTDMPLIIDDPVDLGVEEFCTYCMKCADTCPSNSISKGGMTVYHGVEKWKLQAETCSEYWNVVGTDCAICMAICPFSKPDTPMHSVVRWFVKHSRLAPRLFPIFDDILYGRKWKTKPVSPWLEYNQRE